MTAKTKEAAKKDAGKAGKSTKDAKAAVPKPKPKPAKKPVRPLDKNKAKVIN